MRPTAKWWRCAENVWVSRQHPEGVSVKNNESKGSDVGAYGGDAGLLMHFYLGN